jgi:hypothetical protein
MTSAATHNPDAVVPARRRSEAHHWIAALEERKQGVEDARHAAMVDVFIEHLRAEYDHNFDAAVATMTPDGASRVWGGGVFASGAREAAPNAERGRLYRFATQVVSNAFKFIELDMERFHAGDDGLAMDGTLWNTVSGAELSQWGGSLPAGRASEDAFVVGIRVALFMRFENGLIVGEDMYWDDQVLVFDALDEEV